jgi:hypothetical protein
MIPHRHQARNISKQNSLDKRIGIMQRSKKIPVGDKEVTVTEFSVSQIRDLMDQMEDASFSTIDILFPDGVPAIAVEKSTGIDLEKLEEYHPSELKIIIEGVENMNPFFANMITRLAKAGEQVIKERASTKPVAG